MINFSDRFQCDAFFSGLEKVAFAGAVRGALTGAGRVIETGARGAHRMLYRKGADGVRRLSGRRLAAAGAGTYLGAKAIGKMRGQQSQAGQGYRNIHNYQPTPMM